MSVGKIWLRTCSRVSAEYGTPREPGDNTRPATATRAAAPPGGGRRLLRYFRAAASATALSTFVPTAIAEDGLAIGTSGRLFDSGQIVGFSLMLGVLSAALFASFWLARQRSVISGENEEMRHALSDAGQRISRYEALIADKSRRIVIWDGHNGRPEFLGQLPPETGAPQQDSDFLAFGRWLKPSSASALEKAFEDLRINAHSFDLVIETQRDEVIEVQGRVTGGRAFARFVALNNLRAELAELKIEKARLASSIATFEGLLNEIDQPVWKRAADGRLEWVNHAYGEAVEASSPAEAVRESREILNTATREKIRAAATPESPFRERVSTVIHGNRAFFDVVDSRTANGSCGMAIDVSQAESLREELSRTLKSHADTLDHLATPVAIFDGERRLQFYNQAFQTLWNLDIAFLESRPDNGELLDRLRAGNKLPEQLSWKSWRENALSVYRSIDTQTDIWHLPNGQTLRVIASAHPQGGATWVFENLTEQVELETRYNTLLRVQGETIDHLAEGVAVFGPDGRIRLSNPAFRALWGITEKEAEAGTHIQAIELACLPSYDRPDGWKAFSRMITSFEDERQSRQGTLELNSRLVLDYAVIPLSNAQTMLTFVNMTDSVRAERALKEKNEALRKADELKNDFVQHVSYELRSPLTNIIGFTDLLKTPAIGPLNERQAEYIDHISTSSAVLLTIVNDILDLATVDAGIMQLNLAPIDLNDLLDDIAMQMTDRLQESNVTLEIVAPPNLGHMTADPLRLKQIMIKLLTNAVNFSSEGARVELTVWREAGDLVFTVADSGVGMSEEMLATVFQRFSASGKGGKRSGAGLGLSIVESFVHLHRGSVSIDSHPGKGTVVNCRIPSATQSKPLAATG